MEEGDNYCKLQHCKVLVLLRKGLRSNHELAQHCSL